MMKLVFAVAAICGVLGSQAQVCVKDGDAVAFMGDSITQLGNSSPVGYVNLVMKGLDVVGVKHVTKIPAGISGHKSTQMSERLDRDVLSKKPQWMTFSCGVNDVWHGPKGVPLEQYKTLVAGIFDRCAAANVNVIVLTPTLINEDPNNDNNRKLDAYVAWIKEEAAKRKLRIADLNEAMKKELARLRKDTGASGNLLTKDGVHMSYPGDCMMAWGVLQAMGVAESQKDKVFAAFRSIPGAYCPKIELSDNEWQAIKAKAEASGKTPKEYIRDLLFAK